MLLQDFPTQYTAILDRMHRIDPVQYAITRNYVDGRVTYLSPYLSRGVLHVTDVIKSFVERGFTYEQCEKLLQELCWREFYQVYHVHFGSRIWEDIRHPQDDVLRRGIPKTLLQCQLGITEIDAAIQQLIETGYMHNHVRMYLASIVCNTANYHWKEPSLWMFSHLLDGDTASNTLSWQWVAGSFSSKKYVANQENINRYLRGSSVGTYLDYPYEMLPNIPCPAFLKEAVPFQGHPFVLQSPPPIIDVQLPTFLYHPSHLDPTWQQDVAANRIFIWDPKSFQQSPRSERVQQFIYQLALEIPGIQCWFGTFEDLIALGMDPENVFYQRHPDFNPGIGKIFDAPRIISFEPAWGASFFSYWNKASKELRTWFR